MPTYENPFNYTSPIGAAVAKLGQTLTAGRGSEAQRIYQAEQALKLKNEREGRAGVASVFGNYGTPGFDRNAAMHDAVIGGYDPSDLAQMERYGSANKYGATDQRTTNAFVGAGGAYGSTATGFREGEANQNTRAANALAENARQFNDKPYVYVDQTTSQPIVGTNKTALGARPVLSETDAKGFRFDQNFGKMADLPGVEQRSLAGNATQPAVFNYVTPDGKSYLTTDGVTDVQTRQTLPPGGTRANVQGSASDVGLTNPVKTGLQQSSIALDQVDKTLGYIESLSKDPTNFGPAGIVKGFSQNAAQAADGIAKGLGFGGFDQALQGVREKMIASGVNPTIISGLFDPTLPKLHQAYSLLLYQGAAAYAGQQGRSVTDADIKRMEGFFGNPNSFWSSQASAAAQLDGAREFSKMLRGVNQQHMTPGRGGAPAAAPPPAGGIVSVTTPEEAMRLPSGTQFRTPDGRVKVRP